MDIIKGAIDDTTETKHKVNIALILKKRAGVAILDYRNNARLLASVGERVIIKFSEAPFIELVTPTSADVSYNIRAVHYNRASTSFPTCAADIARIPGAVEIVRSQLLNDNRTLMSFGSCVTDLIKPDPLVGYSPRLDIGWDSLGTSDTSTVTLIVHCVLVASGSDLPAYGQ